MSIKFKRVVSSLLLGVLLFTILPINSLTVFADSVSELDYGENNRIMWDKDRITASLTPIIISNSEKRSGFLWLSNTVVSEGMFLDNNGIVWYGVVKFSELDLPDIIPNDPVNKVIEYLVPKGEDKVSTFRVKSNEWISELTKIKPKTKDNQGNATELNKNQIAFHSTELLARSVSEQTKAGSKALKYGDWLTTIIDLNGGLGTATVKSNSIIIPMKNNKSVYISIDKEFIKLHTETSIIDITNTLNTFNKSDINKATYSDESKSLIIGWDGRSLTTTTLGAFNNFEEELKLLTSGSTKSTISDGVDSSLLLLNDSDDYVVYKKASGALNKYAKDESYESFSSSLITGGNSWMPYSPDRVDLNSLKPSELTNNMKANLWLQLELFKTALHNSNWQQAGSYPKVDTMGATSGTLKTEDIYNAVREVSESTTNSSSVVSQHNVAMSYNSLVKYVSAKFDSSIVIGGNAVNDAGEVDGNAVANNAALDALSKVDYTNAADVQPKITSALPIPKKVPVVSGEGAEAYYKVVYYTLVTDAYMTSSFLNVEGGSYKCDVGDELKQMAGSRDEEYLKTVQISSKQAKFVRAVLSLKDGMDYLGIDNSYCESVKLFCSYYDTCLKFKNNTNVSNYDLGVTGEPLKMFFSASDELLSDYYLAGVAVSASFVPLQTNLYSPSSMALMGNENFIKEFHYKYGFYRKALYVDNSQASAVDSYITELKGTQRIATLKDLFQPESDVVLYVDNNFYNADVLADKQGYIFEAMRNTESSDVKTEIVNDTTSDVNDENTTNTGNVLNGLTSSMVNQNNTASKAQEVYEDWISYFRTLFDVDFEAIIKTASTNEYSAKFFQGTTKYGKENFYDLTYDKALWDDLSIDSYLDEDEYSVAQSFAVVSSIYKNTDIFNLVQRQSREMSPVFISSPTLASMEGIDREQFNTIYNYLMLKNLNNNLGYDYKSTLDLSSPLFIDIYGNISTESGLVVIPAASNATLVNPDLYTPWTAGFLSLYTGDYQLEETYNNSSVYLTDYFEVVNEEWKLKAKTVNGVYMNFSYLPIQADGVLDALVSNWNKNVALANGVPFEERSYLITEVMRGAPLEDIDYTKEGIQGNRAISKVGLSMAYKLDDLAKQFLSDTNGNSIVTLPNLAFIDGIEYIMLFLFKIMFAGLMLGMVISVYKDTVGGVFGIKSVVSGIMSIVITLLGITLVPDMLDWSYYNANRYLLKDDVSYIAMLNLEKKNQGKEIGVGEVIEPQTTTELYVKLDTISIPWYNMFDDVILSDTFDTMTEVYDKAFEGNPFSNLDYVTKKSNGLYVSLDDIFGSSAVGFSIGTKLMYQSVSNPNVFSYSSPYYVILDQLIANVNSYNLSNNILNYSTEVSRDGTVKTKGMIASYFLSEYFMGDNYDITGLHSIYEDESQKMLTGNTFSSDDLERMRLSAWYPDHMHSTEITNTVDELEYYAKSFVENNRELFNKVTDETFLKIMAMQIALQHNNLTHCGTAQAIEIFNIDSKDLLRLTVGTKDSVFRNSAYSFARYTYEEGGTFSVIMMGCLTAVVWLTSLLKPAIMLVILGLLVVSLFLRKILFKKQSRAYEGYFISMGCLCGCNIVYALMLKLSISLPDILGVQSAVSIFISLVVQVVYVLALLKLMSFQLKDWKNIGFTEYEKASVGLLNGISNVTVKVSDKLAMKNNPAYREASKRMNSYNKYTMSGEELLEEMYQRDADKQEKIFDNPI